MTFKMPAKKLFFNTSFPASYFLKLHLHHFSKIKSQKESQNSRNQGFSYYFCMIIEWFGSGSGFMPLTNGSGSATLKNQSNFYHFRSNIFCQLTFLPCCARRLLLLSPSLPGAPLRDSQLLRGPCARAQCRPWRSRQTWRAPHAAAPCSSRSPCPRSKN